MKTTGVVRRIDDLGRIVIPKEIRRTLRIKDGESLEIFLESDNIVLKKFSLMENMENFYKNYVDSVQSEIGENILITNRDTIVAVAGPLKKEFYGKRISNFLEEVIENSKNIEQKNISSVEITNTKIEASYIISTIIVNGDAIGAVMMLSTDRMLNNLDIKTILIASKFLGKYIEE